MMTGPVTGRSGTARSATPTSVAGSRRWHRRRGRGRCRGPSGCGRREGGGRGGGGTHPGGGAGGGRVPRVGCGGGAGADGGSGGGSERGIGGRATHRQLHHEHRAAAGPVL